jgi:hypothetical protein
VAGFGGGRLDVVARLDGPLLGHWLDVIARTKLIAIRRRGHRNARRRRRIVATAGQQHRAPKSDF